MNISDTIRYYQDLTDSDLCQCDYCKNLYMQIKDAYPFLSEYLEKMGIDIEKPFETWPLEPDEKGNITYLDVQYVVMGNSKDFIKTEMNDVVIQIAESHPMTGILEEHFVIEVSPITLKWLMDHE